FAAVVRRCNVRYACLNRTGGLSMPAKTKTKAPAKPRRLIDTLELAAPLRCHPMSIPRYVRTKPGFPQPVKPFGKNLWDEDEVEAYIAKVMKVRTHRHTDTRCARVPVCPFANGTSVKKQNGSETKRF